MDVWRRLAVATAVVGIVGILGVAAAAPATTFTVDSTASTPDAMPGDGICDDGTGRCTLAAAFAELAPCGGTIDLAVQGTIAGDFSGPPFAYAGCAVDVRLTGPGADRLTIAGSLDFPMGATATVSGLTVTGSVVAQPAAGLLPTSSLSLVEARVARAESTSVSLARTVVSGSAGAGVSGTYVSAVDSVIEDNAGPGIAVSGFRGDGGPSIVRTVVRNNGGAGVTGQLITWASVVGSTITGNRGGGLDVSGFILRSAVSVSVGTSTIDGNAGFGVSAQTAYSIAIESYSGTAKMRRTSDKGGLG